MKIDIGLTEEARKQIADQLAHLLADTYTLYLKTHNFHWNVTGSLFSTLHILFEQQYVELAGAVDEIAERIRALGLPAPGSYAQYLALSSIKEETGVPVAEEMIKQLVHDHETVIRVARSIFPTVESLHDAPTVDLLTRRMEIHEKTAWMLRSLVS